MALLDILGYPLVAVSLVEVLLGLALLRRGGGDGARVRRATAAFCFAVASFAFMTGLTYAAAGQGLAHGVLYRLCWLGWLAIPAGFAVTHALEDDRRLRSRAFVGALYGFWGVVAALAATTDLVELEPLSLLPYVERTAPLEPALRLVGTALIAWLLVRLVRARRRSRGHERLQLSYFLLGLILMAVGGAFTAGLQPLLAHPPVDPALGSWFAAPSAGLMFYAVTRHRLFDVRTLLARAVGVGLLIVVFGAVHVALFGALSGATRPTAAVVISFALTATLLLATPARLRLLRFVDRFVRGGGRRHHALVRDAARAVVTILDADELVAHLTNVVSRGLGANSVAIYVAEDDEAVVLRHAVGGPPGGFPDRVAGPALASLRAAGQAPVAGPVGVPAPAGGPGTREEAAGWRDLLALPLPCQDRLQGVVLLGPRTDGEPYVSDDFDVLETLGHQASVALANARLYREATTDDLTGLHHRRYFLRRLDEELARARVAGQTVGLLMVDIDRFKRVNDTFGHPVGDRVLKGVAWTLLRTLRHPDIAARFGGEEFAVLLGDVDAAAARAVAERIRQAVERERYAGGTAVTVSAGVAVRAPTDGDAPTATLVAAADAALYEAKRSGRNRVCTARVPGDAARPAADPFEGAVVVSSSQEIPA